MDGSLLATALHVLVVVVDPASDVPAIAALLPVGRAPVSLGVVAGWAVAAVVLTTALRGRIGQTTWRGARVRVRRLPPRVRARVVGGHRQRQAMYLGTGAALLGAVLQRVLLGATGPGARHVRRTQE